MTDRAWVHSKENKSKAGEFMIGLLERGEIDAWVAKSPEQTLADLIADPNSGIEAEDPRLKGIQLHKSTPEVMSIAIPPAEYIADAKAAVESGDATAYGVTPDYADFEMAVEGAVDEEARKEELRKYLNYRIGDYLMSHCRT